MKRWNALIMAVMFCFAFTVAAGAAQEGPMDRMDEQVATFAGGCFWCMEHPFDELPGVIKVVSGYSGGHKKNPTYEEVSSGVTGHAESVQITFDPSVISYKKLLDVFWMQIDPTDPGGQFVDRGNQYRSAIFYHNEEQKREAEASKEALEKSGRFEGPIVTQIVQFTVFYPAEEYHQHYYKKNPLRYKFYRFNSGRDRFLDKFWGKDRAK
jgi:peptide methionine sulfoxide reductase msrA/msrB